MTLGRVRAELQPALIRRSRSGNAGVERGGRKPFIAALKETNDIKRFMEAMGAERALAAFGEEEILANLPPERREKLRRLLQHEKPSSRGSQK